MENHVGNLLKFHMLYWPSQAILTAVDLNLFSLLKNDKLTAKQLSMRLGIKEHRSYDFFDALVALRFLKREGDTKSAKYSNFEGMDSMLDKHTGFMVEGYKHWSNLKLALETGKSLNPSDDKPKSADSTYIDNYYLGDSTLKEFQNAMDSLQEDNFKQLVNYFDFSSYETMLDLGAGSCLLSTIVNKQYSDLKIINFDLPFVFLNRTQTNNNITYKSGDFFADDIPKAEIIFMGNILHNWGIDKRKILIKKVYDALPSNGVFIVVESFIDDLRRKNYHSLLMSLNMLIEFGEGSGCSVNDLKNWTREIGFMDYKLIQLTAESCAFIAYKSSQNCEI